MKIQISRLIQVSIVGASLALAGCADSNSPQTVQGPLELRYTIQTSPSTTGGTGSKPVKVKAIHFYESYIVVEINESDGKIFPVDKIREFNWSR